MMTAPGRRGDDHSQAFLSQFAAGLFDRARLVSIRDGIIRVGQETAKRKSRGCCLGDETPARRRNRGPYGKLSGHPDVFCQAMWRQRIVIAKHRGRHAVPIICHAAKQVPVDNLAPDIRAETERRAEVAAHAMPTARRTVQAHSPDHEFPDSIRVSTLQFINGPCIPRTGAAPQPPSTLEARRLSREAVGAELVWPGPCGTAGPQCLARKSRRTTYRRRGIATIIKLTVAAGQGHNYWPGFFHCQELIDFVVKMAREGVQAQ